MPGEWFEKGLQARKEVVGPEYVERAFKEADAFNLPMQELVTEFKSHVRGALRNGCTKEEITEVLLQAAVYGGVPVGMSSFALAREVFKEMAAAG